MLWKDLFLFASLSLYFLLLLFLSTSSLKKKMPSRLLIEKVERLFSLLYEKNFQLNLTLNCSSFSFPFFSSSLFVHKVNHGEKVWKIGDGGGAIAIRTSENGEPLLSFPLISSIVYVSGIAPSNNFVLSYFTLATYTYSTTSYSC